MPARTVVEAVDGCLDRGEGSVSIIATNKDVVLAGSYNAPISCDVTNETQAAIEVPTSVVTQVGETSSF